uniref:F-box domain-containing protein n=1 Tax=Oryza barthii TaxID=65489 RepID=A0A0D3HV88_9ORYZ
MAKRRRCREAQQAMAKNSKTSAPCFLPDDVVGEVLLRLPSRSLARFRSVCRSWERRISSPAFVESHHAVAAATRPPKLAFAPTAPPHRWNLFEDHDVRCRECPRVIGPKACRGLVLLGQRCTRTYSVCNLITIGDPAGWRAPAGEGSSSSMPAASFLVQNMDPVLANGCLHWALRGASRVSENDDDSAVLSLSLAAESFRRVPMPPFAKDDVRRCFMDDSKPYPAANPRKPGYIKGTTPTGPVLAELGGRLCMVRDLRHRGDMGGTTFEVYRLDDYDSGAWSLSYRVDLSGHAAKRLMTTWFVVPLCYLAGADGDGDSSDRIMLATTMQEVHVYDPKTRTLETLVSAVHADEAMTRSQRQNSTASQQESPPFSLCNHSEDLPTSKDYLRFVMFHESLVHLEGMEYGNSEFEILDA